MTAEVALRGVRKGFGATEVVRGVDLVAPAGSLTVFLGPSGCGKTTLLRLVAGLEEADSGEVAIGGRVVNALPPKARDVAIVFQSYALYPHMTVAGNLSFALEMAGLGRAAVAERVRRVARMLEIDHLLERKPRQLSGGQQQRVAMGRAMVREPAVYLFDEPLSNLDTRLRTQMRAEIARLQRDLGATMIYVTHDQVEAMTLADQVVLLDRGVVAQAGPPLEVYRRPATVFVAGFLGAPPMNLCAGRAAADGVAAGALTLAVDRVLPAPGTPLTLGIRPEHVRLGDGPLRGRVKLVERLGAQTLLRLDVAGVELTALDGGESRAAAGDEVPLALPAERLHLFGADGRAL